MQKQHIDVTVDCTNLGGGIIDLSIPSRQRISKIIINILKVLKVYISIMDIYYIKVPTKKLVIVDTSGLVHEYMTTGDIIEICK